LPLSNPPFRESSLVAYEEYNTPLFDKKLPFDGKSIRQEKDWGKEKSRNRKIFF
jgi:hypothetical protein